MLNLSKEFEWTEEQLKIIQSAACDRLLVDAGPGTGKTAVLSARIAWLIEEANVSPGDIWVVSFTRTAVAELRDRVGKHLDDPQRTYGIRIATIDSYAWTVNSGFIPNANLIGSFEQNIQTLIELVRGHKGVFEYLSTVQHLFVDESQDVVGHRVELLLEIIHAIPGKAGVTVFCDEAQAIYGFADAKEPNAVKGTLPENIRNYFADFQCLELTAIHRTADPVLSSLYRQGRELLRSNLSGIEKLKQIRTAVRSLNHGKAFEIHEACDLPEDVADDSFFLFRTRGEALYAAHCTMDRPFRLRMAGLPHVLKTWLGVMFWDWARSDQTKEEFYERWSRRIPMGSKYRKDKCWADLVQYFGKTTTRVDVRYMNRRLASLSPPVEFCELEFGHEGPIFGTIHTSKGRETGSVYLYLPRGDGLRFSTNEAATEEAKVVFVGASRARNYLFVGNAMTNTGRTIEGVGRAFQEIGNRLASIHFEVGRAQDIDAEGLTGKNCFASYDSAKRAQSRIHALCKETTWAESHLKALPTKNQLAIFSERFGDEPIAFLSDRVKYDLRKVTRDLRLRHHSTDLKGLRILGCRTLAISEQSDVRHSLHSPWCDSGFMLAPLLTGYPVVRLSYAPENIR